MDCQTTSWDPKIRFRTKIFIRLCHLAAPLLADAAGPGARFESFGLLLIHAPAPPTLFCNPLEARPRLSPLKRRKQKLRKSFVGPVLQPSVAPRSAVGRNRTARVLETGVSLPFKVKLEQVRPWERTGGVPGPVCFQPRDKLYTRA